MEVSRVMGNVPISLLSQPFLLCHSVPWSDPTLSKACAWGNKKLSLVLQYFLISPLVLLMPTATQQSFNLGIDLSQETCGWLFSLLFPVLAPQSSSLMDTSFRFQVLTTYSLWQRSMARVFQACFLIHNQSFGDSGKL